MAELHAGLIDDRQAYSHLTLAKIIDADPDWVRRLLENKRIPYKAVGRQRFVSGMAFRLWVESHEQPGGAKEAIDDQHPEPADP